MTEPYTYTDADGDELTVTGYPDDEPNIIAAIHRHHSVRIPAADVPDVIRGFLAQAAAATGRDAADPLAHIRRDLDLAQEAHRPGSGMLTIQAGVRIDDAARRVADEHLPMLYALAAAYLGDDAPIWGEIGRVQRERDTAKARADRLEQVRVDARDDRNEACKRAAHWEEVARAALADAARLRTAWHSARGRARKAHIELADAEYALANKAGAELLNRTLLKSARTVNGHFEVELEPARELLMLWCAAVRKMLEGAENYGECEVTTKPPTEAVAMDIQDGRHNVDAYTLTLQRRFRPTPHELRQRAERERDQARALLDSEQKRCAAAEADAEQWRDKARIAEEETRQARAELELLKAAVENAGRGAALAARHFRNRAANAELRAENEKLRAESAAADAATAKWDAEHAEFVTYAQALRAALGEVLAALTVARFHPNDIARWHRVYGGPIPAPKQPASVDTGTYDNPDDALDANGMTADQWNAAHPVGTPVNVCIKTGELIATTTRTRAWTLGSGHAVVSVTGMTGGISLGCVEPREAAEQHPA